MDWLAQQIGSEWARALAQLVGINVGFVVVLMIVAYTVLAERRVLGFIQGRLGPNRVGPGGLFQDRKSTRLNSSHANISYAVFCLKKKKKQIIRQSADHAPTTTFPLHSH